MINKGRLKVLADFLMKLPADDHFNISCWEGTVFPQPEVRSCGFVGCAIGWACQIPAFQEIGLKLIESPNLIGTKPMVPSYDGETSINAVAAFFDISYEMADNLFIGDSYDSYQGGDGYVSPQEVAARIYQVLNMKGVTLAV